MYTIKEFSKLLKLKVSTIRYYERVGLLRPQRAANGYRCYQQSELEQVCYITVMKYADFSIAEMKQMFSLMSQPFPSDCERQTDQLIATKEQEIQHKIARFTEVLQLLAKIKPLTTHHEYEAVQPQIDHEIEAIYYKIMLEEKGS